MENIKWGRVTEDMNIKAKKIKNFNKIVAIVDLL